MKAAESMIQPTTDLPLGSKLAPVALNGVIAPIEVPTGTVQILQAWLADNPGSTVHLRVEAGNAEAATTLATSQRWITNGKSIAVVGPCYVYPAVFELDGTVTVATANDKLVRSRLP